MSTVTQLKGLISGAQTGGVVSPLTGNQYNNVKVVAGLKARQDSKHSTSAIVTRVRPVAERLMAAGFPILQTSAIIGNLIQESALMPLILNRSSKAVGLAQWLGDRKKDLVTHSDSGDDVLIREINHVIRECQPPRSHWTGNFRNKVKSKKSSYQLFMESTDLAEAVHIWRIDFERPGEAESNDTNRIVNARATFEFLTKGTVSPTFGKVTVLDWFIQGLNDISPLASVDLGHSFGPDKYGFGAPSTTTQNLLLNGGLIPDTKNIWTPLAGFLLEKSFGPGREYRFINKVEPLPLGEEVQSMPHGAYGFPNSSGPQVAVGIFSVMRDSFSTYANLVAAKAGEDISGLSNATLPGAAWALALAMKIALRAGFSGGQFITAAAITGIDPILFSASSHAAPRTTKRAWPCKATKIGGAEVKGILAIFANLVLPIEMGCRHADQAGKYVSDGSFLQYRPTPGAQLFVNGYGATWYNVTGVNTSLLQHIWMISKNLS